MKFHFSSFVGGVASSLLFFISTTHILAQAVYTGDQAEKFFWEIPENFKSQIREGIPTESFVSPQKSRKLLVVNFNIRDKTVSKGHPSIPYANYAFQQMGIKTGAFETWFTDDTLIFCSDKLFDFDAIVLNNTVGVLFQGKEARQGLLDYVYSGRGIMGIHGGAGATFVQYPEYDQFPEFGEMLGGYENGGHPWKTNEYINMIADEPAHPVVGTIGQRDFDISDEIYQYTDPYSREKVRVLLSVNKEKTDMGPDRRFLAERKLDGDFPVSWIRSYGRGRVFNSSLGHHPHINWDPRILDHNFRAIQYILGDLSAPSTPSARLTSSIIAQEKIGWRLGLTAYSFKDNTLFETIDKAAELGIWYLDGLNVQKVSADIPKDFDYKLSKEELLKVRAKLLSRGVSIVNYYIHDIPNDEAVCKQIFEFGKIMGIEAFIAEPKPEALDLVEKYCNAYNINLAIHNHGKDISPVYWDPKNLLKAIEKRSPLIGACGDIGYWQRNGIDPVTAINTLKGRLITIQVHDLDDKSSKGHDVVWGTGISNLDNVFKALQQGGIKPTLIGLEYSYNWGKSIDDIVASKNYFDKVVIQLAAQLP